MVYLYKELFFLRNNAKAKGMPVAADLIKEFQTLENECLDLFSQYAKFRFNRFPFAVKRKVRLLASMEKQMKKVDAFLAKGKAQEKKYLAAYKGKRFALPEKGIIDIKTSYSDYIPLSWGGAPGFTEYENGRVMAKLGIVGSCSPNYVSRAGYRFPTPEVLENDKYVKNVFTRYVKETGLTKFTSHEIPTGMIPYSLVKKYDDTTYIVDLKKGTKRKPKNRFEYTLNKSGVGIISSAAKSKEYQELLGIPVDMNEVYGKLYNNALKGNPDCGGLISYNYISGEPVTGLAEGRPLFVRTAGDKFNLANFMRAHLHASVGVLKIGNDILFNEEKIKVDRITGHGGLFKTAGVGQRILAAAINSPISVMETAGEGGPWGMALLASYLVNNPKGLPLDEYLDRVVFAGNTGVEIAPTPEDVEGFNKYIENYKACLGIEEAAVKCKK
jgi:hypothetical protein